MWLDAQNAHAHFMATGDFDHVMHTNKNEKNIMSISRAWKDIMAMKEIHQRNKNAGILKKSHEKKNGIPFWTIGVLQNNMASK